MEQDMVQMRSVVLLATVLALVSCGRHEEAPPSARAATVAPVALAAPLPDVGKLEMVAVSTTGYGASPAVAVNDALRMAIQQVNGATMSTSTNSMNVSLDVSAISNSVGPGGASGAASVDSIKAQGFAEQVVQRSRGAVTEFRVVTTNGPSTDNCVTAKSSMQQSSQMNSSSSETASFDGKASGSARSSDGSSLSAQQAVAARSNASDNMSASQQARGTVESSKCEPLYAVTIEAKIAKFKAPADSKKIKIVVAPVRFDAATFVVGNSTVPAGAVAQDIHQQILDALANTGRFSVLDREFGSDVQQELDMIATGQAPSEEIAKLGQAMTADVIWVGRISSLAYNRHARRLQTSDRELVSYSGGWAMSQRIVNTATRQIMVSDSAQGEAPSVGPTTLGTAVDGDQILRGMEADMASRVVAAILTRTFPVTVASREGNSVVLSQGGHAVQENGRYELVSMGAEIKDPQTGQSLGRMEAHCCELVVEKVTPSLAYGHLENVRMTLDAVPPGGLQLRGMVVAQTVPVADAPQPAESPSATPTTEAPPAVAKPMLTAKPRAVTTEPSKSAPDDKW
jgi:curli biogenesis system outer membrane secretion channel CsgG